MPVRLGTTYTKSIKVRWTDKDTGKRRTKAFHWWGPAEEEADWLRRTGHADVVVEALDHREAFIQKLMRSGSYWSRGRAEAEADMRGFYKR